MWFHGLLFSPAYSLDDSQHLWYKAVPGCLGEGAGIQDRRVSEKAQGNHLWGTNSLLLLK